MSSPSALARGRFAEAMDEGFWPGLGRRELAGERPVSQPGTTTKLTMESVLQLAGIPPTNHCVAIRTDNSQFLNRHFAPFIRSRAQRSFVVDVGEAFADFSVSIDKVETAPRHFASQSPVVLS